MSTLQPPPENATPPVPWLDTGTAPPGGQTWSSGVRPDALLVARFGFAEPEFRRCWMRIIGYRLPALAVGSLLYGLTMILLPLALFTFASGGLAVIPPRVTAFVPLALLGATVGYFVLMVLFGYVAVWIASILKPFLPRKPPTVFLAGVEGVQYELTKTLLASRAPRLKWAQVGRIVSRDGDLYFLPKSIGVAFYVPRSAFADDAAQARFADAVTALWKASGDISALNPDAVAEFR